MNITAIIPSLNPDEKLLAVVDGLAEAGFAHILLVDDGSKQENKHFFAEAVRRCSRCELLCHSENRGKGKALKTALACFLQHPTGDSGVITVDGDGQHCIDDVLACAAALRANPQSLVLGCRSFTGAGVPARSALGNRLTAWCFRALCGVAVSDTQTGLRAFSAGFARRALAISGERFEFETNMLLETKRLGVPICEVPIKTVYLDGNAGSHFSPLRDSLLIYRQILRFAGSGAASLCCDFMLFLLLEWLLRALPPEQRLLAATAGARLCSSVLNFVLNKRFVFGSEAPFSFVLLRYYALCVVQGAASYGGVFLLAAKLGLPAVVSKIMVDFILFLISFQIQREFIFTPGAKQKQKERPPC